MPDRGRYVDPLADHFRVERAGRSRWRIVPLTDHAMVLLHDTVTPAEFESKREADEWLHLSLATHLTDDMSATARGL
jgi:hypothetical protein